MKMLNPFITRSSLVWSLLLGISLTFTVSGCQFNPSSSPEVKETPTQETSPENSSTTSPQKDYIKGVTATQPWKLVFVAKDKINPETGEIQDAFWEKVWQGIQEASEELGIEAELVPNDCQTCVEEQITAIAKLLETDLDGMIVGVVDSLQLVPVLEKAIDQEIPVVAVDTPLNSDRILSLVGFDNYQAGEKMGKWVVQQLPEGGKVALLNGPLDQQNAVERRKGFLAGLETGQNIEIVATQDANWETDKAKEVTETWLQKYPDLDVIVSANDRMALGAAAAVEAAQKDDIMITGFDALDIGREALAEGKIQATIDQGGRQQGRLAVYLLVRHLENQETFEKFVPLPEIPLLTQDNL